MSDNTSGIANSIASKFIAKEERLEQVSKEREAQEAARVSSIAQAHKHLNEQGKPEFLELGRILQEAVEQINADRPDTLKVVGNGISHIEIRREGQNRIAFLYFKYLQTNGAGTGPCIECFFGPEGADIGNNSKGLVAKLIPYLTPSQAIVWGPENSRPIGAIKHIAEQILGWFQSAEAKFKQEVDLPGRLMHVDKLK